MSGVNANKRKLSDERVGHDLKGQRRKGFVVVGFPVKNFLRMIRIGPLGWRNIERRRQVVNDRIEQRLHAFVLERRSAKNREQLEFDDAATQRLAQFLGRDRLAFEELMQHLIVVFGDALYQLGMESFGFLPQLSGNLFDFVLGAHRFVAPVDRLHVDEIDYTLEIRFLTDGNLDGYGAGVKTFADGIDGMLKIGAHLIHLVNEADTRDPIFIGLPPYGLRLRLDAMHSVEYSAGAVQNAQGALHLGGEVYVAGCIDDVDADVAPEACGSGRRDGDTALLLLLHPVHRGGAFVHFADTVRDARIKKDALSRSGLAGIDVGHDADVPATL